jgi:hypothetical protein
VACLVSCFVEPQGFLFCMLTELASLCFASKSWHDPKIFGYANVFALPSADIFWDWGEQMSHPRTHMANRRLWVR